MAKFFELIVFTCLIAIIYAKTVDEIKAWFMQKGMECSQDYPVSQNDMQMLHEHKLPDSKEAKCLLACVYRKANWLNEKGMFDVEAANALIEKEHADDNAQIEKSKKLFDTCKKVNEEPVGDGDTGCDRSAHLFTCLTEQAAKILSITDKLTDSSALYTQSLDTQWSHSAYGSVWESQNQWDFSFNNRT